MWGVEHTAMAIVAGCFAIFFMWTGNRSWLGAALLSQVPFWGGSAVYWITGDTTPVEINLALNLTVAATFIEWGHRLQSQNRGGVVHVWLSIIFLFAVSLDVIQLLHESYFYMQSQELLHYLALVTIGGRAYVVRIDGSRRYLRNRADSKKSGRLV